MSDCMQFLFGRSPGPCLCCTPLCVTALLYIISFIITQTTLMPELDRGCASASEVTRKAGNIHINIPTKTHMLGYQEETFQKLKVTTASLHLPPWQKKSTTQKGCQSQVSSSSHSKKNKKSTEGAAPLLFWCSVVKYNRMTENTATIHP